MPCDPNILDGAVVTHHDCGKEAFPCVFCLCRTLGNGGGRGKIEDGQVRLHSLIDRPDIVMLMQAAC